MAQPTQFDRGTKTLVLGGARSGKSEYAESLLTGFADVRYVATGYSASGDAAWAERVTRHRRRRPTTWSTLESLDLPTILAEPGSPVLIDCLSLWLTRTMDATDAWNASAAGPAVENRISEVVTAWTAAVCTVVAVTSEVGLGVIPETLAGAAFRDALGVLNRTLAAVSDEVWLVVAGIPLRVK